MGQTDLQQQVNLLAKKVRELEDIEAIKTLHREYLFFISNLEFAKALDCFSADIVTEVANYPVCRGKAAVEKFFNETIYQNVKQSKDAHFTGQAVIAVDGDHANGHWMFYRLLARPSKQGWVQGRYDCEYVRESGAWKFSRLKMQRPWPAFFADS